MELMDVMVPKWHPYSPLHGSHILVHREHNLHAYRSITFLMFIVTRVTVRLLLVHRIKESMKQRCTSAMQSFYHNIFVLHSFCHSMLLGIIADTHDRLKTIEKALALFKERDISTLLHAGDFISPFVIPLFKGFQVYGTFGNNDGEKKGLHTKLNDIDAAVKEYFCEVQLDNTAIAVTHGHIASLFTLLVDCNLYDLVVTGHTHIPEIKEGNPTVINPGECCGYLSNRSTVAVFDTQKRKGEIIEV